MKIYIIMDVEAEYADPDHPMGVTNEGYEAIVDALISIGGDIDVRRDVPSD
jgi:hypothetical protein